MDSLIPANHFFAVLAALFAIAAFGFWAETKAWGKLITPGILVGVAGYIIGTPLGLLIYRWW